jgi:hypothetical protein
VVHDNILSNSLVHKSLENAIIGVLGLESIANLLLSPSEYLTSRPWHFLRIGQKKIFLR